MFRCHPFPSYYLLLVTAVILLTTSGRAACQCLQDQSAALLRLKASFRFAPYATTNLSSWKVDTNCCTWEGITCDGTSSVVTALDLSYFAISGTLSTSDILELTSLRFLSLAYNYFDASPWPSPGFELLTDLEYLDLCYYRLYGNFHIKKGQLSNLITLILCGIDLNGFNLESLIDSLGSLQKLNLSEVNISVSPTNLTHASSANTTSGLRELRMVSCTIAGGGFDTLLLSRLANLVMLELIDFDIKYLNLHNLIDSLSSLQSLHLRNVNISASPADLARAYSSNTTSSLRDLTIYSCTITSGRFDTILTKLPFLSMLTLDGTEFNGPTPVPERFQEFSSLTVLSLQSCGLTGTFPPWIFHIKSLLVLDVSSNENLCGGLPEFRQGSALQVLRLSSTKFSGNIPVSIGNLRNLVELHLFNCQFHGQIPSFAHCLMISSIVLSSNNLNGSLPSDGYHSLHNLTSLVLHNNSISGVIPASLFSHPSLEFLDLSLNNFTGNFLLYPNISSKLVNLDVSDNKLQGPIPKILSQFVGLQWLDLSSNNLTGTVDLSFMKNIKDLSYLSLSYNKLSIIVEEEDDNHSYGEYPGISVLELASCNLSCVPKFLMQQRCIYYLDLSNNNIGGHIPDWIWETASTEFFDPAPIPPTLTLDLSHNFFTSVATDLSLSSFVYIDLHSNMIKGAPPLPPLPPLQILQLDYSNNHFNSSIMLEFWSRISSYDNPLSLSLANNSIIGEVPHLICDATSIEVLDLSFNNFSGLIPPCLLKQNNGLQVLKLRGNNFNGSLPNDINENCTLQIIDLNGNKLEGKLPVSMINCKMLQVLDVGNNLIMDIYPGWMGDLPLLKVLVLRSNKFHGPIDYSGMNRLQVLDLSSNSFNGSISTRFLKQFNAMMVVSSGAPSMYVGIIIKESVSEPHIFGYPLLDYPYHSESITVMLKGQKITLAEILSAFMSIDLSNNNFEGIIPDKIGDLKLLKGLNLSRNSFTGGIPPQIANMLQLESLDLSVNNLSGEIPPAMAQMTFLEVLNLSYNHLSGPIPQSGQFLTFPDSSFLGNNGLCGKPLARLCKMNDGPPAAATPGSSKQVGWEILSVEAGVVSGLAIVVTTTLLWGNGRRWLYWHVDRSLLYVLQPWMLNM